jgi:hypothetical protein
MTGGMETDCRKTDVDRIAVVTRSLSAFPKAAVVLGISAPFATRRIIVNLALDIVFFFCSIMLCGILEEAYDDLSGVGS